MAVGAIRASKHLRVEPLDAHAFAVWNAYFPSVAVMEQDGLDLLSSTEVLDLDSPDYGEVLEVLLKHRLVYRGDEDPYEELFFSTVSQKLGDAEKSAQHLYEARGSYGNLYITNSACNLGCSYCISAEGDKLRPKLPWQKDIRERKLNIALSVLDQYLLRKRENGDTLALFSCNGGEILLEWPLLRELLFFARANYPDIKLKCGMNTNMTRMTPEIAKVLDDFE